MPKHKKFILDVQAVRPTVTNSTTSPTSTTAHKLVKKPPGRSRPGSYPNRSCFFCGTKWHHYRDICPASGQTCSCCHKTDHFAGVRQQVAKDNRVSKPTSHKPTPPDPRRGHMRLMEQIEHSYTLPKEDIQYENFFTLSSGQPPDTSVTTTASPSNKGHFVLFLLDKPDSNCRVQISFQIDSVDTSMRIWPTLGT